MRIALRGAGTLVALTGEYMGVASLVALVWPPTDYGGLLDTRSRREYGSSLFEWTGWAEQSDARPQRGRASG
jgi:hypothetical protein